ETMKRHAVVTLLVAVLVSFTVHAHQSDALSGAWHTQHGDIQQTAVFVDGYLSHSVFDVKNKKFISTRGGTYVAENGKHTVTWQYDTEKAANDQPNDTWVGKSTVFDINAGNELTTNLSGTAVAWQRVDANEGPMAGVWRITGRKE